MGKRDARQEVILKLLTQDGQVEVAALTGTLGVTEMTIRRDLADLQKKGIAQRVHGGARRMDRSPFELRSVDLQDEKMRIGVTAASMVRDGETIGIDSGTTAHAVALALRDRSGLQIVTNSIHVAAAFRETSNRVFMLGGRMLPELSLVGPATLKSMSGLSINRLFLGCGGITERRGFSYFDIEEAEVRRGLLSIADELVIVADHRKFGRTETISVAPISAATAIVTDRAPNEQYLQLFEDQGVSLLVAQLDR
jgi:DeoR/GlpR family transcriptional regulator of sugar metabolism